MGEGDASWQGVKRVRHESASLQRVRGGHQESVSRESGMEACHGSAHRGSTSEEGTLWEHVRGGHQESGSKECVMGALNGRASRERDKGGRHERRKCIVGGRQGGIAGACRERFKGGHQGNMSREGVVGGC